MYLVRELTELSWPSIGEIFSRDHTTVINGHHSVKSKLEEASANRYKPAFFKIKTLIEERAKTNQIAVDVNVELPDPVMDNGHVLEVVTLCAKGVVKYPMVEIDKLSTKLLKARDGIAFYSNLAQRSNEISETYADLAQSELYRYELAILGAITRAEHDQTSDHTLELNH